MADARHVQLARDLAERDARAAADLAALRELQADVEELRAHADALARFRAAYPGEQERLRAAAAHAREELASREVEVTEAAAELARAKPGDQQAEAQRALDRASEAARHAQRKLTRLEDEREALESDAARGEEDLPHLEQRALALARRVAAAPRTSAPPPPTPGLEPVADWSSRARAALFVAAGSVETDREHLAREASELAAAALGEATLPMSVAAAAARIADPPDEGTMPASPS